MSLIELICNYSECCGGVRSDSLYLDFMDRKFSRPFFECKFLNSNCHHNRNNSFFSVVDERYNAALEEARLVDEMIENSGMAPGHWASSKPLLGVPLTVKESIGVTGEVSPTPDFFLLFVSSCRWFR